ncbi:hypothetical protein ABZ921_01940 [Streptomyces atriruber]|uniref:Uncharacterized protein n=1 Tax=Streptomyces atriruber TaxID=545121 RepID=A0ABV3BED8_9ACTN
MAELTALRDAYDAPGEPQPWQQPTHRYGPLAEATGEDWRS